MRMELQEVLREFEKINIPISSRTLLNYEKWGLIPAAKRTGLGRGKGRVTEYPDIVIAEGVATWKLLNGKITTSQKHLREVRDYVLMLEKSPECMEIPYDDIEFKILIELWASYRESVKSGENVILTLRRMRSNNKIVLREVSLVGI
jgi:hypothetical protein